MSLAESRTLPSNEVQVQPSKLLSREKLRQLSRYCPPPLALALLVFALSWLLGMLREPLQITMGDDDQLDQLYLATGSGGFFQPEARLPTAEKGHENKVTYRWAGRTSYINLPWPIDAVPLKATLHASAPRPGRSPDKGGTILKVSGLLEWDRLDLGQFDLTGLYQGSDYVFKIPVHLRPNLASLSLKFEASDLYPAEVSHDPRGLSVIFFNLKLEPDYAEFGWRGWLATLARPGLLAVIVFCIWGIARLTMQNSFRALLLEGLAGSVLLFTMLLWPLAAEPLYAAWAFILPFAWGLLGLAVLFCRRANHLPAPFVFAATFFPIMPLAQFAFGRLDLYTLNPSSVIIGLYFGALLTSAAFYINSRAVADPVGTFERAFERSILGATLVSFAYAHFSIWQVDLYRGSDFKLYYQTLLNNPRQIAEPFPPALAILLWPFQRLFGSDVSTALIAWRLFNGLLLVLCLVVLVRVFGGERQGKRYTPAVIFLVLNFGQIAETTAYGQYIIILLLGLSLVAWEIKRGRFKWAGAILALPIGLKIYSALTLLYFVARKQAGRIAVRGAVAGWLFLLLLAGLAVDWGSLPFYFSRLAAEFSHSSLNISNQSWWGFLGRLALPGAAGSTIEALPPWLILFGYGGILGAVVLTLYTLWQTRYSSGSPENINELLKFGTLLLLGLLIMPLLSMPLTAVCLLALLGGLVVLDTPGSGTPRWQLLIFGLAYAILAYGGRYDFFQDDAVGLARLGSSYRFLGICILWLLCLKLSQKSEVRSQRVL